MLSGGAHLVVDALVLVIHNGYVVVEDPENVPHLQFRKAGGRRYDMFLKAPFFQKLPAVHSLRTDIGPDILDLGGGGIDRVVLVHGYIVGNVVPRAVKGKIDKGGTHHVQFLAVPLPVGAVSVNIVPCKIQHPGNIGIFRKAVRVFVAVAVAQMHRIILDRIQVDQLSVHVVGHALGMDVQLPGGRCRDQNCCQEHA